MDDGAGTACAGGAKAIRFGHQARGLFLIEPDTTYLNHGGFSCTPRVVMQAAAQWRETVEAQPSRFMREALPGLLRDRAGLLAAHLNADARDIVFVENATAGMNAVLRSLVLMPGDEILATTHSYGSVRKILEFVAARAGARLVFADVPYPCAGEGEIQAAFASRLSARTRLVVLDHVTSPTALVYPLELLVPMAAERGAPVLVDGAHGPGQVPVDLGRLQALGVSWYVANGHKWLGAPKGCAFLWTRRERQGLMRPTSITETIDDGYVPAFDWPGTKDFSPYLALDAALEFRARCGEEEIARYCHDLAVAGAATLAETWGTETGGAPGLTGCMATARLPGGPPATARQADRLRDAFMRDFGVELVISAFNGALWARVSAYLYNEIADYRLAAAAGLKLMRR